LKSCYGTYRHFRERFLRLPVALGVGNWVDPQPHESSANQQTGQDQ